MNPTKTVGYNVYVPEYIPPDSSKLYQLLMVPFRQYLSELPLQIQVPFLHYDLNFWYSKNVLHCLGTPFSLHRGRNQTLVIKSTDKQSATTNHWPALTVVYGIPTQDLARRLFGILYQLFEYLHQFERFSKYHLNTLRLKWSYEQNAVPFLDFPSNYFRLFRSIIFYIDSTGVQHILTDKILDSWLAPVQQNQYIFPYVDSNVRADYCKSLRGYLVSLNPETESLPNSITCADGISWQYQPASDTIECHTDKLPDFPAFPSASLEDALAEMCCDSLNTLQAISRLLARAISNSLPSGKLWCLNGPKAVRRSFLKLLQEILPGRLAPVQYSKLLDKQNLTVLIEYEYNKKLVLYEEQSSFLSEPLPSKFRSLVTGEVISSINDDLQGELDICSTLVCIYSCNQIDQSYEKNIEVINLHSFQFPKLSPSDLYWLRTVLPLYGLRLLADTAALNVAELVFEEMDEFFQMFCSSTPQSKEGVFFDKKLFIESFHQFYEKRQGPFPENRGLGNTTLSRRFAEKKGLALERVRSNENRLAYKAVTFDQEKFQQYLSDTDATLSEHDAFQCAVQSITRGLHCVSTIPPRFPL